VSGTCWGLNISACPNPATLPYDATVKVTSPSGTSIGTIIFLSGDTGNQNYEEEFTYGSSVIDTVVGAGTDGNGPISLACLPSTSMQWARDHILRAGTLCATAIESVKAGWQCWRRSVSGVRMYGCAGAPPTLHLSHSFDVQAEARPSGKFGKAGATVKNDVGNNAAPMTSLQKRP